MNAPLAIGRLATRIRSDAPESAQALAGAVRQLADRQLPRALDAASTRALARAGLPAGAQVAVQRLELALRVGPGIEGSLLAEGWAGAFEAALATLLAAAPAGVEIQSAGGPGEPTAVIWFADAWAAERLHLERRATGATDAWWAPALAGHPADARGHDDADALDALPILLRWLERDPPRAVATMAEMAEMAGLAAGSPTPAHLAGLLSPEAAGTLTGRLIRQFARGGEPSSAMSDGTAAQTLAGAVARIDELPAALLASGTMTTAQAAPWLAASLFARHPALTQRSATQIERVLHDWPAHVDTRAQVPPALVRHTPRPLRQTGERDATPRAATSGSATPPAPTAQARHEVHAGGLLLLLRPLVKLDLLPPADALAASLGDLALTALRRVLAPLPAGARAVAEERERPLLQVFAPECDWRAHIPTIPVRDADAAAALLDRLIGAIPADIAFAPGAERRVFGPGAAACPTAAARQLTRLLLRPGVLRTTPWEAELTWPLAAIDLALRRAGWDQDPGWLPWLGRSLCFRFGDTA